ncbi:TetR/AcrR family transcriptional regulator [Streptomyces sp. NPDC056503]|uniref:TetR/AcrR family transcriptional regulator n=1 Tax=Streptomyces sp. NPDC056503 TaxID=3345842 RepID=UPI0036C2F176
MSRDRSSSDRQRQGLDLLWGDTGRPARGPQPGLSVAKIVTAAIEITDAEGLDALSMQRVAARLDFTTMSLYRYVPGKDQLVELMMDTAAGSPPDLAGLDGWRARIECWVQALWECYAAHPWMLQVKVTSPPLGPNQLAWLEAALAALAETGLPHQDLLHISLFLLGAVGGLARLTSQTQPATAAPDQAPAGYAETLASLLDADRFPTLSGVIASGTLSPGGTGDRARTDAGREVAFGVERLLDGIEAYVRSGSGDR